MSDIKNFLEIFINLNGTIKETNKDPIFGLSHRNNILSVIAPFDPTLTLEVAFEYANRRSDLLRPLTLLAIESREVDVNGNIEYWNEWTFPLGQTELSSFSTKRASDLFATVFITEIITTDDVFDWKGQFTSLSALNLALPVGVDGEYVGVGSGASRGTLDAFAWISGMWQSQGVTVAEYETNNNIIIKKEPQSSSKVMFQVNPVVTPQGQEVLEITATDLTNERLAKLETDNIIVKNQIGTGQFQASTNGALQPLNDTFFSSDNRVANYVADKINTAVGNQQVVAIIDQINQLITNYTLNDVLYNNTDLIIGGTTDQIVLREADGTIVDSITLEQGNIVQIVIDNFNVAVESQPGPAKSLSYIGSDDYVVIFDSANIPLATETNDGLMSSADKTNHNLMVADILTDPLFDGNGKVLRSRLNYDAVAFMGVFNDLQSFPANPLRGDKWVYVGPIDTWEGVTIRPNDYFMYNGANWDHLDSNDEVASVSGKTGVITLQIADLTDSDRIDDLESNVEDLLLGEEGQNTRLDDLENNLTQETDDRIAADESLQAQISSNDGEIETLELNKEDLTNKKVTLAGFEASDDAYLSAKAIQGELDKKLSTNNNNSITSKVTGFGIDDLAIGNLNTIIWNKEGTIKFVRSGTGADAIPTTHLRYIKKWVDIDVIYPDFALNPEIPNSASSIAYFYEDFADLITQNDIDNDLLYTDITGPDEVVGGPKVKIGFAPSYSPISDDFIRVVIAMMDHKGPDILALLPLGFTSTQATISASRFHEGRGIYLSDGSKLSGSLIDLTLNLSSGEFFSVGSNFGGEGNPDFLLSNSGVALPIFKVVPGQNPTTDKDRIYNNGGIGFPSIIPNEYADNDNDYVLTTSGVSGGETVVSLLCVSLMRPGILYQIMAQAPDGTSSTSGPIYNNLESAKTAISKGEISYADIKLLNDSTFFPIAYVVTNANANDFSNPSNATIIPVSEIGGKVEFVNQTGDINALNVLNVGVVGFNNQELLNIEFDNRTILHSSQISTLDSVIEYPLFIFGASNFVISDSRDLTTGLTVKVYDNGILIKEGLNYTLDRPSKTVTFIDWVIDEYSEVFVETGGNVI